MQDKSFCAKFAHSFENCNSVQNSFKDACLEIFKSIKRKIGVIKCESKNRKSEMELFDENTKSSILNLNDRIIFHELESNLLEQLSLFYCKEKFISDDLLESLYFIYKNPLLEALNLIDKYEQKSQQPKQGTEEKHHTSNQEDRDLVILFKSNDERALNRRVYQVKGSMDINYYMFGDHINFCSCSSFKYNVLVSTTSTGGGKGESIYCKHMVLLKLFKAMNRIVVKYVKDNELVQLLKRIQ